VAAGEGAATGRSSPPRGSRPTSPRSSPARTRRPSRADQRLGRVIPLGVYGRKSLWQHLDADYIFDKTREGFAYYEEKFGVPYPFAKYDQLFVPEFNAGAMENAGAVTFTETYVFRSKVTDAVKERRVVTILHELAHMWFGDLVTMKWWNDLWLNESFAEWASTIATAEATEWTEAWTTFNAMEKTWAYRQDQLPSTHPVVAEINDLDDVRSTSTASPTRRAAPSSSSCRVGGHRGLLRRRLRVLPEARVRQHRAQRPARRAGGHERPRPVGWSKKWLETAGVNTLAPEIIDGCRRRHHLALRHRADGARRLPDDPPAPPRRRLLRLEGGALVRTHHVELDVDGDLTEVPELVGLAQPDLVLNDEDLAYAKIRLDERSLTTAIATSPTSAIRSPARSCGAPPGTRRGMPRRRHPTTSTSSSQHRRRDRVDDGAHDARPAAARGERVRRPGPRQARASASPTACGRSPRAPRRAATASCSSSRASPRCGDARAVGAVRACATAS
jgi:aminopeptidase N